MPRSPTGPRTGLLCDQREKSFAGLLPVEASALVSIHRGPGCGPHGSASASVVATSHQRGSFFRASQPCTPHRQPEQYARRHSEQTPLYRLIARHVETWFAERSLGDKPVAAYFEAELRGYLRCGILSFGFARARCGSCGHDFLVDFSCKGRGVCPSCNGRRMAQTAAHLVDHVIPPVPVRQWVVSVPKRLRWFLGFRSARPRRVTPPLQAQPQAQAPAQASRSCRPGRSPPATSTPLPNASGRDSSAGSSARGSSTPRPQPTCSPGSTAGTKSTISVRISFYAFKCVSPVSPWSISCGTVPGPRLHSNGSA